MARIVISDPESGKGYQLEPEKPQLENLIGLKIGDRLKGEEIGLPGYELKITGGSDEEGFPMRADVGGEGRTRALFSGGTGYNSPERGSRKRKTVRGNVVSHNIAQLNVKVEERGEKPIGQILGLEPIEEEIETKEGPEEVEEKGGMEEEMEEGRDEKSDA